MNGSLWQKRTVQRTKAFSGDVRSTITAPLGDCGSGLPPARSGEMNLTNEMQTQLRIAGFPTSPDVGSVPWLEQLERDGTNLTEALSIFDALPAVPLEAMVGRWRGAGLHTGHRLDGMLKAFGWYGKAFADGENVHPLLFRHGSRVISIDPRWLPVALTGKLQLQHRPSAVAAFKVAKSIIATESPTARLRQVSARGVSTAAMVYDRQPIIDFFRTVAPGIVLGLMDFRGHAPLFFTLRRVGDSEPLKD